MRSINLFVVLKLAIVLLAIDASIRLGTSGLQDSTVYNDSDEYKDFNLTNLVRFESESESGSHRIGRQLKLKKFNFSPQHQPQKRSRKFPAFPRIAPIYNLPSQRLEQKADRRAEYEEDNAGYAAVLG